MTSADIYEITSLSNGTIIPASSSSVTSLQAIGSELEYSVFQQFGTFAVEYQPALELTTHGKPLSAGVTVVSLEMELVSIGN